MANYPQELAQDAVCQSHTGHMTGLWFLPTRPLRLNTNVDDDLLVATVWIETIYFFVHDTIIKSIELLSCYMFRSYTRIAIVLANYGIS